MLTSVIVGCPSAGRSWILNRWLDAVYNLDTSVDLKVLQVIPSWDEEAYNILDKAGAEIVVTDEKPRDDIRDWSNENRLHQMTHLRNILLSAVRFEHPDYFLSLDSDIILQPDSLSYLLDTIENTDANAVGGLTYLDPDDISCTNLAFWDDSQTRFRRVENPGRHQVDILMAFKLMDRGTYNIDYRFHKYGEDFGWSNAVRESGLKLFCDGRAKAKHIMGKNWLNVIDKRLGF